MEDNALLNTRGSWFITVLAKLPQAFMMENSALKHTCIVYKDVSLVPMGMFAMR